MGSPVSDKRSSNDLFIKQLYTKDDCGCRVDWKLREVVFGYELLQVQCVIYEVSIYNHQETGGEEKIKGAKSREELAISRGCCCCDKKENWIYFGSAAWETMQ